MKFQQSFINKPTGTRFTVEVEINQDEVARFLAARAFASKAGKSRILGGDIKCRVISREDNKESQ